MYTFLFPFKTQFVQMDRTHKSCLCLLQASPRLGHATKLQRSHVAFTVFYVYVFVYVYFLVFVYIIVFGYFLVWDLYAFKFVCVGDFHLGGSCNTAAKARWLRYASPGFPFPLF